eukprot:scaffold73172_cov27-Phaeocystis_antarctica.AAC.1
MRVLQLALTPPPPPEAEGEEEAVVDPKARGGKPAKGGGGEEAAAAEAAEAAAAAAADQRRELLSHACMCLAICAQSSAWRGVLHAAGVLPVLAGLLSRAKEASAAAEAEGGA